jgi:AraC-like DNA-binding protein
MEYEGADARGLIGPGSLIIGNSAEPFTVRHFHEAPNRRLVVNLDDQMLAEVASERCVKERIDAGMILPGAIANYAYGLMRSIARGDHDAKFLLASAILEVPRAPGICDISVTDRRRVADVINYMEVNFAEPCTLATLAAIPGVSRYHLIRTFRAVTGATPNRYLAGVRLRNAAAMLIGSKKPIAEVIFDCGFNDVSHFYAMFHTAFRCTPRAWRRRS